MAWQSLDELFAWAFLRPTGCREWLGRRLPTGYGRVGTNGYAHRRAYELAYGEIPAGMIVCHACDNPPCIEPSHLFLGTHLDNARDRDAKGRGAAARGYRQPSRKRSECKRGHALDAETRSRFGCKKCRSERDHQRWVTRSEPSLGYR